MNSTLTSIAAGRAATSNQTADQACQQRDKHDFLQYVLDKWSAIMLNEGVFKNTIIFLLACVAEVLASMAINRDFVHSLSVFTAPEGLFSKQNEVWGAVVVSLLVNGLAAVASHYFSKSRSLALFRLEVFNLITFRHRGENFPEELAQEEVESEKRSDFRMGILVFLAVNVFIGVVTYNRVTLQNLAHPSTALTNWLSAIIPFVVLWVEVLTGIYIVYLYKRLYFVLKNMFARNSYQQKRAKVANLDKMVVRLISQVGSSQQAKWNADIWIAVYRALFRNSGNPDYVNPVVAKRRSLQLYLIGPQGQGIPFAVVYGQLYDGLLTTGLHTANQYGEVLLTWEGFTPNRLDSIVVNGQSLVGPFDENQRHILRVPVGGLNADGATTKLITSGQ